MNNIKLSIAVMAHPARSGFFPYLHEKLGNCPIIVDNGAGLWDTARRAWEAHDPDSSHHVVIQDDAIICHNFGERAIAAIAKSETVLKNQPHILNFYHDQMLAPSNPAKILKAGYILRPRVHWAVAICFPVSLIPEMLRFSARLGSAGDDEKISLYLNWRDMVCYFPMPSLVDHRNDIPSVAGTMASSERRAWKFID
jgi:hypothetical protein